ncbi:hypothetical protein TD95_003072 [Thielaviopsis punctulata]|uniref:DRBM domain-containing protein n=1 Tax=Thielaviopsis punctulata TaxID=72032 RepID=A0A0F4ZFL8_9PEZI|nr:hypothetical protein TD95_003072 [Thielaviopsis punctulata]
MLTKFSTLGLCRRRGWADPSYGPFFDSSGYTCYVLVNGRKYQTDIAYESQQLAQENAAMRAFMVCQNFSVNGGMLARNGVVQGLPAAPPMSSNSSAVMSGGHHRSAKPCSAPRKTTGNVAPATHPRFGRSGSSSSHSSYEA